MKRILIADHHPVVCKGISCMLDQEDSFEIIAKANNGDELYKYLEREQPDILIMEIDMPQISGQEARCFGHMYPCKGAWIAGQIG